MQYFLYLNLFIMISIYISLFTRHLQLFYISKNSFEFNETLIHLFNFFLMTQFNLLLMMYYCNSLHSKRSLSQEYYYFTIFLLWFHILNCYFISIISFLFKISQWISIFSLIWFIHSWLNTTMNVISITFDRF